MNQIIGHTSQIVQIERAFASGRLPNAYLFSGPKGIGKHMVATLLARALSCQSPSEVKWGGCLSCAGCIKVMSGNHPDQFHIEPDGNNIKIEQIRTLQSKLNFHPLESKAKMVIVDDADRMTEAASNSLLKVLEEPPDLTHFVLISSMPHRLLPTIRSRCQTVPFRPLSNDVIVDFLIKENETPKKDAVRIAKLANGSLGTALSVDASFIDETLGKFFALASKPSTADIIETAQAWANEEPNQIRLILDLLASWYRDVLHTKAVGDTSSVIHSEAIGMAEKIPLTRAEHNLTEITKAHLSLEGNVNKQLMFEQLLFSLTG